MGDTRRENPNNGSVGFLVILFTVLMTLDKSEAVSICNSDSKLTKVCENESDCNKHLSLECYNGECTSTGQCECAPCWQGPSCNEPANLNPPLPTHGHNLEVAIPADYPMFDVFLNIETKDLDYEEQCLQPSVLCPCVDTNFDILEDDYSDKHFGIKNSGRNGAIYIKEKGIQPGNVYTLTVSLTNDDGLQSTEVTVRISISQPLGYDNDDDETDNFDEAKFRGRRDLSNILPLDANDTVSFSLEILSPYPGNVTNITIGTHVGLQVTIAIPPAVQIGSMSFEFFAENNASTFGVVCEPGVKNTGRYITYEDANPSLDFNLENYFQAETAYITLTNITNRNGTLEDQLELEFGVTIINNTDFSTGEISWISIGAEFLDFSRIWVGQVGFFVDPLDAEIPSAPEIAVNSSLSVNVGESSIVSLLMNIYEHSFALRVSATIIAPANSPGFHICKFGLRKTGEGYCLENTEPTQTFVTDEITGYHTAAMFDFKEIVYGGENGDTMDSLIVMDLSFYLMNDAAIGEQYTVQFDVDIEGTVYTETALLTSSSGVTPTESLLPPAFAISFPEIQDTINYSPNELLQLVAIVSFPTGVYRDISISVAATLTLSPVSLLTVDTVDVGYNIGCFDTCSSFLPRLDCPVMSDVATLPQGVFNHGLRCWEGDDDIRLLISLRIADISLGMQTVTVSLDIGSSTVTSGTFDMNVVNRASETPSLPQFISSITSDLSVLVGNNDTQTIVLILPPNTEYHYTLKINSDVDWFVVKEVTATFVGNDVISNLGNLVSMDLFAGGTYNGSVGLGFINNIALFANETSSVDSGISIDVTLGFMNGASVSDGEVANMNYEIIVSDGAPVPTEVNDELPFTVTAINTTEFNITSKFEMTCASGSFYISPGEIVACVLTMNFTDLNEFVNIDVESAPNISDSIGITIHSLRIVSTGSNLMTNGEPTYSYEYSLNNTQLNRINLEFGFISNSRTSGDPADDQMILEIEIQATDTPDNENGTKLLLGTGASVSDKLVWVAFTTFIIQRTGSETPKLEYNFTLMEYEDDAIYNIVIQHEIGVSSAEVSSLSAILYHPPYLVYESSFSEHDEMSVTRSGQRLTLSIPSLLFTDTFNVSLTLLRDCSYQYTFKQNWKATSLLEIQYQTHNRDADGVVDAGTPLTDVIKDPIVAATYDFNITEYISHDKKPADCLSPSALGMENGDISDCQITSSGTNSSEMPFNGRRNGLSAWIVGKSGPYGDRRWLKIDIGRLSVVTMIQTQGGTDGGSIEGDIGEYEVFYSRDDIVYKRGYHVNGTNTSSIFDHRRTYPDPTPSNYYDLPTTYLLAHPVEARYILILLGPDDVGDGRVYNALRAELYGCFIEAVQPDICPNEKSFTKLPEEYDRGFVVDIDSDALYVCNVLINDGVGLVQGIMGQDTSLLKRGKSRTRCFKTQDTYSWQSLDDHIRNVIGYSPSTSQVYAIAGYEHPAYVASDDNGFRWNPVSVDEFKAVSTAVDYVTYKTLPVVSTGDFNYVNGSFVYESSGNWEASFDGMFGLRGGSQEKILDWNSCCKGN